MITQETAYQIACLYQEIERAQKLLDQVQESVSRRQAPDIRDAFGSRQSGLQLGVPSGENSTRLYMVDWFLCVPVLKAHIGQVKAQLSAMNELARAELGMANAKDDGAAI
jgi:hypothetical protein